MKREILFKAKRTFTNDWIEGYYILDGKTHRIFEHGLESLQKGGIYSGTQVHPETVCQFTGLLDKNGKKIFDGDKLECSDIYNDEPYTTNVRFEDAGFLVDAKGCDYNITCIGFLDDEIELEIIGNIHD